MKINVIVVRNREIIVRVAMRIEWTLHRVIVKIPIMNRMEFVLCVLISVRLVLEVNIVRPVVIYVSFRIVIAQWDFMIKKLHCAKIVVINVRVVQVTSIVLHVR